MTYAAQRPALVAIGDLGLEHLVSTERWEGGRHDGVAVRSVAGLAAERPVAVVGTAAADEDGDALVDQLETRGVATAIRRREGPTRQEFSVRDPDPRPLFPPSRPRRSRRCPVCGVRQAPSRSARLESEAWLTDQLSRHREGMLVFDRLSDVRQRVASDARRRGLASALLLLDPGPLRFLPAVGLLAAISKFDLVILGWRVTRTLERRLGLQGLEELAQAAGCASLAAVDVHDGVQVALDSGQLMTRRRQDAAAVPDERAEAFLLEALRRWRGGASADERGGWLVASAEAARPGTGPEDRIALPRLRRGIELATLRERLGGDRACPVCRAHPRQAQTGERTPARPGARVNVGWLLRRSFAVVERPESLARAHDLLQRSGTAYCVGSGGSFPVAAFASHMMLTHGQLFAQPIRPMDYVRTARATDVVVVVSYSGSTPDAASAMERARELGVGQIVLLCAPPRPSLAGMLRPQYGDQVLSYGNPRRPGERERGFVSIAGTVAPCVLLTAAVESASRLTQLATELPEAIGGDEPLARRLAEAIRTDVALALFGGGNAWPAMLDLESKWVEGDLGPLSLHEVKDFSHGRFLSVLGGDTPHQPLLLSAGALTEYERLLVDVLGELSPIVLTTGRDGLLGTLELLIRCQFLTERVARSLNRDISRPEYIPEDGLKLYRWERSSGQPDGAATVDEMNVD